MELFTKFKQLIVKYKKLMSPMLTFNYTSELILDRILTEPIYSQSIRLDEGITMVIAGNESKRVTELLLTSRARAENVDSFNISNNSFLQKHDEVLDVLDCCFSLYCPPKYLESNLVCIAKVNTRNNFEKKYNQKFWPSKYLLANFNIVTGWDGKISSKQLEKVFKIVQFSLNSSEKKRILRWFREGALSFYEPFAPWFKIVEILRGKQGIRDYLESNKLLLQSIPQFCRHAYIEEKKLQELVKRWSFLREWVDLRKSGESTNHLNSKWKLLRNEYLSVLKYAIEESSLKS